MLGLNGDDNDRDEAPGAYLNDLLNDITESDVLNSKNPIFAPMFLSSKISFLIKVLDERFVQTRCKDKIVIVSEWVGFLDLIEQQVGDIGLTCGKLIISYLLNMLSKKRRF